MLHFMTDFSFLSQMTLEKEFTLLVNQMNNLAKEQVILPSSGHILVKWCNGAHCVHILVSTESQHSQEIKGWRKLHYL